MFYEVTISTIENGWIVTVRRQDQATVQKFYETHLAALVAARVLLQIEIDEASK